MVRRVNKQPTQRQTLLKYLQERGSITQLAAHSELRIWRLAARIKELRDHGHNIKTIKKRDFNGAIYALYRLEDE